MLAMVLTFTMSIGMVTFAASGDKVTLKTTDKKTTAVGTIASNYNLISKDVGGAGTAIDGDSDIIDRNVFTAIFALNKNGGIVNSKTKSSASYNMLTVKAHCKSFKSYHQIQNANGKPLATRKSLTA